MKNGMLTISRITESGANDDMVSIHGTDEKTGIRVFEVKITLTEFSKALMNIGFQPCDIIVRKP